LSYLTVLKFCHNPNSFIYQVVRNECPGIFVDIVDRNLSVGLFAIVWEGYVFCRISGQCTVLNFSRRERGKHNLGCITILFKRAAPRF
jgi:hypothetical protein